QRDLASALLSEVERDRALVAADGGPPQAVAVEGDPPRPHRVAVPRRLHLDDIGAVVAEQLTGERAGDEAAQLEHPHAAQRSGFGTWGQGSYFPFFSALAFLSLS